MTYKLGSLFDGSGGFPLAGSICGIDPVWASEIEPYPIAVTRSRFPNMKHLGSVTDIKGNEIEPVDIITFGSPCQDLSVAGKRAGLKHEANGDEETTRSGLFMEAVRIIKEMREATNGKYPRFALWENVPGAFSSNKGEDFRIVLEELIRIVEPTASMPKVPKGGWAYADSYSGDGWSISYRVFDAQYFGKTIRDGDSGSVLVRGTPQRRRRIYLVLDLGGQCAGKVLFERKGLRGDTAKGRTPWQRITENAERSVGAADCEGSSVTQAMGWPLGFRPENVRVYDEVATTLCNGTRPGFCNGVIVAETENEGVGLDIYNLAVIGEIATTLTTATGQGASNTGPSVAVPLREVVGIDVYNFSETGSVGRTLSTSSGGLNEHIPCVIEPVAYNGENITSPLNKTNPQPGDPCHTLGTDSRNYLVYCLQGNGIDRADTAGCNGKGWNDKTCYTLNTIDRPAVVYAETQGVGVDLYNQTITGSVSKSMTASASDADHVPCVITPSPVQCTDVGWLNTVENTSPTLLARQYKDPHLVCFGQGGFADYVEGEVGTLRASGGDYGGGTENLLCYWDGSQVTGTLTANNAGGNQRMPDKENFNCVIEKRKVRYIVRRLTPTECARLQGFPDKWGHPEWISEDVKGEAPLFWRDVYMMDCVIKGKKPKPNIAEMQNGWEVAVIRWHNKLHSDSNEYKMWGNGIALPCALYVMQGVGDALN